MICWSLLSWHILVWTYEDMHQTKTNWFCKQHKIIRCCDDAKQDVVENAQRSQNVVQRYRGTNAFLIYGLLKYHEQPQDLTVLEQNDCAWLFHVVSTIFMLSHSIANFQRSKSIKSPHHEWRAYLSTVSQRWATVVYMQVCHMINDWLQRFVPFVDSIIFVPGWTGGKLQAGAETQANKTIKTFDIRDEHIMWWQRWRRKKIQSQGNHVIWSVKTITYSS